MRLIELQEIVLHDSDVPEEGYEEWSSSASYNTGAQVLVSLDADGLGERTPHKVYQSLADDNSGLYPPDNPGAWQDLGATNRWAMFDQFATTQTVQSGQISVRIGCGGCDVLGLFRVDAVNVSLTVYDGGEAVFSQEIDLAEMDIVSSWYDYFFSPYSYREDLLVALPLFDGAEVEVVFNNPDGQAACGLLAVGKGYYLGETQFEPKVGLLDYSKIQTDKFGRTYLSQGAFAKSVELDVEIANASLDKVRRKLTAVRGQAVIWDANNDGCGYESLIVYGFFRQFELTIPGCQTSICTLDIEGLI